MAEDSSLEQTEFDYIVLGTGLIESILAGSLARIGKKVLHVDSHQNYGGNWAVLSFRDLYEWTTRSEKGYISYESNYRGNFRHFSLDLCRDYKSPAVDSEEEELSESLDNLNIKISSMDQDVLDRFIENEKTSQDISLEEKKARIRLFGELLQKSRSYNLDTVPKLLGTRDDLVETLIRSGVGRYLEFKNVENIYVFDDDSNMMEKVPSSKEDIFTNKAVSLIEKRKLMKFLTFSMDYENAPEVLEGYENMTYSQFLQDKFKITGKLQQAIIYAIALSRNTTSAKEGLESTHRFVKAMGRFGRGSYLCPLYGGGSEIGQAFCRVCAVYGGTYILNQPLESFIVDRETNDCTGIITKDKQEFKCKKIIAGLDYLSRSWIPNHDEKSLWVSRAILVTDIPLASIDSENFIPADLSYSLFPPGSKASNKESHIYGIHQSHESMACPPNQFVTYLWTTSQEEGVVEKAVDLLLQSSNNKKEQEENKKDIECKFVVHFEQRLRSIKDLEFKLPNNIIPCSDPDATIDFNTATMEAKESFYKCEPKDTEFMPAAEQDPDEEF
ncbi:rab protein geranylgeranyltransferase component A [Backusella circina FSU 941]|nr:rab protein geranylgeranyltransferase component A [Backusella circina FSU 941]